MAVVRNRGRGIGPHPKPNRKPNRYQQQYTSQSTSGLFGVLLSWICIALLDIFLTFRLEYLYPLYLVVHETHDLWRSSSLSSFFFLLITITTDMTIYSISKHNEYLFILAGFLVWIHVVYSGENKVALHTFTVASLIVVLEMLINYHSKLREGGYFKAEALRPVAAHCIGYPLVSIGYCLKRYMAYLLRLRKQGEVENKNKFYYQLLHEALPPENYHHRSHDVYQLDFSNDKDENSSTSSDAQQTTDYESKVEKDVSGWCQRIRDCISDVACFNRPSSSPLVVIKSPTHSPSQPSSSSSSKSNSGSGVKWWDRVCRFVETVSSSLQSMVKSKPKSASSSQNSQNVESGHTVHNSTDHHQKNANSSKVDKNRPNRPLVQKTKDPSPKGGSSSDHKNQKSGHKQNEDNSTSGSTSGQYRSPAKSGKKENSQNQETNFMQIKTPEEVKRENGICPNSGNTPNKQLDFTEVPTLTQTAETKRLNRELNRLKKIENELRSKIKDLEQHEDFTREELDSLRKRENQIRSHLNKEKERRIEVEQSLKREEELRRTTQRTLEDERRKNSNTAELEETKKRVRSLEMEQETLRKETNSRQEECVKFQEERNGRDQKIKEFELLIDQERREKKNTQEKLDGESRLKMQLLVQLNKEKADRAKVEREIIQLREELRHHRRSPLSPSPIQPPSASPSSPNSSFSNGFGRFPDNTIDQFND